MNLLNLFFALLRETSHVYFIGAYINYEKKKKDSKRKYIQYICYS